MKKIIAILLILCTCFRSIADEGMWLPTLLGKQVYADMVKKGLKLTAAQLYDINKASIKDAIVIFGNGCTGEIVSNQGLIFTNHHCGYSAIAGVSSVQNNILKDGFWALNKNQEIPAPGLTVQFLLKIEDVTAEIAPHLEGLDAAARSVKQAELVSALNEKYSDASKNIEARVSPLFKGNQFLVFVYQRYSDIRLVGTPQESIGKFGGDSDNWEWPRHTGDFSVFRVYAAKNGDPASFSAENTPLKPKYFLPISLKGFKDGDYAMVYGYPGSTNRYESSYGIKLATDLVNPTLVALRDIRLKTMLAEMVKDPAVKLRLAADYASIANYWKFYDGETKQLLKQKIYEKKQQEETKFIQWAKGKAAYENIFNEWPKVYEAWKPYAKQRVYLYEGILGSPLARLASSLVKLESDMIKQGVDAAVVKAGLKEADAARNRFLAAANNTSDQQSMAIICQMFFKDIDKNQHPIGFYEKMKATYGDLAQTTTYQKWAEALFKTTLLLDDNKWKNFLSRPDASVLQNDPAFAYAGGFLKSYTGKFDPLYQQFLLRNNDLGRLYLKGIMEMEPQKKMYPDATFTMRVSYGSIASYLPRDGVKYDAVCTMSGMLEKYIPGDYEFDLPGKLVDLARKKDFGQYIDTKYKDLVVNFITNNDITGGNSGSPVLDGYGNLIGLAFDGNYEALSHKLAFDKNLNRTICVDIRYVLWCIDKIGNAQNIIQELKLVKM